jgi:iron complex outermembrane recepter protein
MRADNNHNIGIVFALALLILHAPLRARGDDSKDAGARPLEMVIRGVPLSGPLEDISASATVLHSDRVDEEHAAHFGELIDLIPNLSWAGGTNRPRFVLIRGIGELEQYEGAPNTSVGFILDDVDLSGLGSAATLFDISQIEVLRGPQSIRYGSSALGGVVSLRSTDPTPFFAGRGEVSMGSDDLVAGGLAAGGPLDGTEGKVQFRFSAHHAYQDGFRSNVYLNRDNTNAREESTVRAKIRWLVSPEFTADLTYFYLNIDNGYDAFAIDNSFTTQSDRPGRDAQGTGGGALKLTAALPHKTELSSITSLSHTSVDYTFDGDWGNNSFWAPFDPYDYFSATFRKRSTAAEEIR